MNLKYCMPFERSVWEKVKPVTSLGAGFYQFGKTNGAKIFAPIGGYLSAARSEAGGKEVLARVAFMESNPVTAIYEWEMGPILLDSSLAAALAKEKTGQLQIGAGQFLGTVAGADAVLKFTTVYEDSGPDDLITDSLNPVDHLVQAFKRGDAVFPESSAAKASAKAKTETVSNIPRKGGGEVELAAKGRSTSEFELSTAEFLGLAAIAAGGLWLLLK
jgi:hypothetical protein